MKCKHKDGDVVSFMGMPVDACLYQHQKVYRNVTVVISRCVRCGHTIQRIVRQDNTEEIDGKDINPL